MNRQITEEDLAKATLPQTWIYCFNDSCPRSGTCLRHMSSRHIPEGADWGYAVFPNAAGNQCSLYHEARIIRAAWGFNKLFSEVKAKDAPKLRRAVKEYLGGNGTYYQYMHGKRMLTPEQQEHIARLFRQYGYTGELEFDGYSETIDI